MPWPAAPVACSVDPLKLPLRHQDGQLIVLLPASTPQPSAGGAPAQQPIANSLTLGLPQPSVQAALHASGGAAAAAAGGVATTPMLLPNGTHGTAGWAAAAGGALTAAYPWRPHVLLAYIKHCWLHHPDKRDALARCGAGTPPAACLAPRLR